VRWIFLALLAACGGRTGLGVGQHAADAGPPPADAGSDAIPIFDASEDVPAPLGCANGLVKIADTGVEPDQLVLDGGFLYWHDRDGISRVHKAGGAVQALAQGAAPGWPELAAFALSNTDVYFAFGPQITMVSKQGGPPQPIPIPIPPNFPFVATSKTMLYAWSGGMPGPLFAAPLGGGPGAPVANLPTAASKIVVDGTRGYTATDGGVQAIDLGTGTVTWLSGLGAADVAADASDVYFTTIDVTNGAAVMRVPKAGGPQSTVAAENGAYAVALSATDLYFTERLDMLVRKVVGKTSTLVVNVASFDFTTQPIALALDDQCVYVTVAPNGAPGAIYGAPQ